MTTENPTAPAPDPRPRKLPKETKGEIDCLTCENKKALIKQTEPKSGAKKFYIDCSECGLFMPTRQRFQDYVLEHGRFYNDRGELAPEKSKPTAQEKRAAATEVVLVDEKVPVEKITVKAAVKNSRDDI